MIITNSIKRKETSKGYVRKGIKKKEGLFESLWSFAAKEAFTSQSDRVHIPPQNRNCFAFCMFQKHKACPPRSEHLLSPKHTTLLSPC